MRKLRVILSVPLCLGLLPPASCGQEPAPTAVPPSPTAAIAMAIVGEQPPAGLYEPVSGFGMVWRGEIEGVRADVRQRLGWATEPESGFDTAYQCETTFYPGLWDCFLRGPRGEIFYLRPDSTAQVHLLWEERQPSP